MADAPVPPTCRTCRHWTDLREWYVPDFPGLKACGRQGEDPRFQAEDLPEGRTADLLTLPDFGCIAHESRDAA